MCNVEFKWPVACIILFELLSEVSLVLLQNTARHAVLSLTSIREETHYDFFFAFLTAAIVYSRIYVHKV